MYNLCPGPKLCLEILKLLKRKEEVPFTPTPGDEKSSLPPFKNEGFRGI
jgi:hypothetical protein